MNTKERIDSISDIGLCLQSMIKTRYKKKTKPIYNLRSRFKSMHITFYKSPYVYQFYVEDKTNQYNVYLLKNEKIVKKDSIQKGETLERFYTRMTLLFNIVN